MTTLIAGVGNIFFGDDGFGVEVIRRLAASPPEDATVVDFGIRGVHLAYELLARHDLVVIADCMARGEAPGTLYVLDPDVDAPPAVDDAHGMHLPAVFASVRAMGGALPRIPIGRCEPATTEPQLGLSEVVQRALPAALDLVRDTIRRSRARATQEDTP